MDIEILWLYRDMFEIIGSQLYNVIEHTEYFVINMVLPSGAKYYFKLLK